MNRTTFVIRLLLVISLALVLAMWARPSTEWFRIAMSALVLVGAAGVLVKLELLAATERAMPLGESVRFAVADLPTYRIDVEMDETAEVRPVEPEICPACGVGLPCFFKSTR